MRKRLYLLLRRHSLTGALLLYILAATLNVYFGNVLLPMLFPDRVVIPDISFEILPYWNQTHLINDLLQLVFIGAFLYLGYKNKFKKFDKYFLMLAIVYFLRALTIMMNPVGHSWSIYENRIPNVVNALILDNNGFFFSGHTAFVTMLSLFIYDMDKRVGRIAFLLSFVVIVLIMVGRSHYLIDVYGALITVGFIGYWLRILPFKKNY
ncbi:MAG: hypothetical protein UT34_C0001G0447 [candidate division WS6 bacterium GW2011_GWF2_39_15]|uniref:Sphingomyelin synthase-like domain-containing protein n=1 Tax=candidate division WS6 bacterium GW2011_GWF2_39_15 TaxID=1619100 RepID=A0A0G0QXN3_9BACT|nr:MAG: hypothetical protein UT34_C0001G0447 [candidate division WS6 bacterium GW2011_GWF2_39_15]